MNKEGVKVKKVLVIVAIMVVMALSLMACTTLSNYAQQSLEEAIAGVEQQEAQQSQYAPQSLTDAIAEIERQESLIK